MAESQILSVIRLWAAVAWADGVLAEAEADALNRLIRSAELTPEERTAAGQLLDRPVELPEAYLETLSEDARRGIYRAACKLAAVDRVVAATEWTMLGKLRGVLAIAEDVARDLEADIPGLA